MREKLMMAALSGFLAGVALVAGIDVLASADTPRDYEVTVWENGVPRRFKAERVHLRGGVLSWEGGTAGPDTPFRVERR